MKINVRDWNKILIVLYVDKAVIQWEAKADLSSRDSYGDKSAVRMDGELLFLPVETESLRDRNRWEINEMSLVYGFCVAWCALSLDADVLPGNALLTPVDTWLNRKMSTLSWKHKMIGKCVVAQVVRLTLKCEIRHTGGINMEPKVRVRFRA